jgi:stage II sporulation protein D
VKRREADDVGKQRMFSVGVQPMREIAKPLPNHRLQKVGSRVLAAFLMMIGLPALTAITFRATPLSNVSGWLATADAQVTLRVLDHVTGKVDTVALNDYVLSVLTAETAANTPMQALQSAAIAARTYAIQAKLNAPKHHTYATQHAADVTDNPVLDLPMDSVSHASLGISPSLSPVQLANYQSAVEETDGLIVTYHGSPILAFMFPISNGKTRDAQSVFGGPIPYLRSTTCPADTLHGLNQTHYVFSAQEVAAKFGQPATQIRIQSVAPDGYVRTVQVGSAVRSGDAFAQALGLKSADFQLSRDANGSLHLTTYGIGIGLGMSLHQAAVLATAGKTWSAILSTFYPGTQTILDARVLES